MDQKDSKTTHRILAVADTVATRGPVSLNDLVELLPYSRAAIWRCLDTLRQNEWVRMRHGDKAFELTSKVHQTFSQAYHLPPHFVHVNDIISRLEGLGPFHVDYGEFIADGVFTIRETTRKNAYDKRALSLTYDIIAVAAQTTLDKTKLLIHLREFMQRASPDEIQHIQSGDHNRVVMNVSHNGLIWDVDRNSVSIPSDIVPKVGSAFRLTLKKETADTMRKLEKVAKTLRTSGIKIEAAADNDSSLTAAVA